MASNRPTVATPWCMYKPVRLVRYVKLVVGLPAGRVTLHSGVIIGQTRGTEGGGGDVDIGLGDIIPTLNSLPWPNEWGVRNPLH